jgi:Na+-driven multidrug efflux pump
VEGPAESQREIFEDAAARTTEQPRSTGLPLAVPAGSDVYLSTLPMYATNDQDISKEILLDSISRTTPQEVLGDAVADHLQGGIFNNHSEGGNVNKSDNGTFNLITTPTPLYENVSENVNDHRNPVALNEDVQAVLAFSEEAAAAAEATLSPELVVQLELSKRSNATTSFVSDTETLSETVVAASTTEADALPEILPASQVVGEPATKAIVAPDVRKILKFAIPAIGVWLCGPLLSLIDTSAVGIFSGTVQQAALNPAVAVTDYAALLIAFMYTGTTNMVAAAQESDRATLDKPRTAKTMIGAMQMSTFVGSALGTILFVFARPLLKAIIGNDAISPAVFAAAMKYVRIRALGMPAAAIIGSTQAACLGMQDIRSPLYVLVAAAVVNFFGDVLFVGNSHPLIGGAAGAAWATVISQYVAVAYFVRWLCNKPGKKTEAAPQVLNVSDAILEMTGSKSGGLNGKSRRKSLHDVMETLKMKNRRRSLQAKLERCREEQKEKKLGRVLTKLFGSKKAAAQEASPTRSDDFTVRGFLQNRFSPVDLFKFPNKETRKEFAPYVVPVTTTQVGRVSGYVAMSHVVASSLGTVSMAAQQVIVSLFYCLCPIADSLSLTAQSLIPVISEKEASTEKAAAMGKAVMSFLKAGAVFGGAMMAAVSAIPLLSGLFTSDATVIGLVNSVVPLLLVFFATHGFVCASEGLLLGQKDLGFLGKMYAIFFGAVPFLMLRVKRAALAGSKNVGLTSVWNVFVGYQVFRCAVWLVRAAQLQRRTTAAANNTSSDDLLIAP